MTTPVQGTASAIRRRASWESFGGRGTLASRVKKPSKLPGGGDPWATACMLNRDDNVGYGWTYTLLPCRYVAAEASLAKCIFRSNWPRPTTTFEGARKYRKASINPKVAPQEPCRIVLVVHNSEIPSTRHLRGQLPRERQPTELPTFFSFFFMGAAQVLGLVLMTRRSAVYCLALRLAYRLFIFYSTTWDNC